MGRLGIWATEDSVHQGTPFHTHTPRKKLQDV